MISGAGYSIGPMIMGDIIAICGIFVAWIIITAICAIGAVGMFLIKNVKNVSD